MLSVQEVVQKRLHGPIFCSPLGTTDEQGSPKSTRTRRGGADYDFQPRAPLTTSVLAVWK